MAISTYSELKTAVIDFAHRSDLTSVIDTLVIRAEAALNRKLRLKSQETDVTLSLAQGSDSIALPSGFLEMISLQLDLNDTLLRLEQLPERPFTADQVQNFTGIPSYYRISSTIDFDVKAAETYTIYGRYYKKWDIAADNTNWLLTNHPDLYMDAVLFEVGLYVRDPDLMESSAGMASSKIDAIILEDSRKSSRTIMASDPAILTAQSFNINKGY